MGNKVLILNEERINWKLQRMAYQIWEHNSTETSIVFIGIEGTGTAVAESLASRLKKISKMKVEVLTLAMNKKNPLSSPITLKGDLTGKPVILVDDVANSGRTMLYALKPVLESEPKKIMVAVLVDRKHKSFPVSPDIVGHTVATTLQEHIQVTCDGDRINAAYLK
jgi:pyrimidine operon attenuation protein/uracil phosphoribosyltransferase